MLEACRRIAQLHEESVGTLLEVGELASGFGFMGYARQCFKKVLLADPTNVGALVDLGNLARDCGQHSKSRQIYANLLQLMPNHPVLRRNFLLGLEYDPTASLQERFAQARAWGAWAVAQRVEPGPRPPPRLSDLLPLRVGYISADFCQHTVGLFIKEVLAAHDPLRVRPFAYDAGHTQDWVSHEIRQVCQYRSVAALDDFSLARLIQQDKIDVLVDLSGHTAGSRLTVFTHRPAFLQVSWLGYFATTGLSCMDALLTDRWHAPAGSQVFFSESIVNLARGRLCYTPLPFAPPPRPSPYLVNGFVTFGSFNNTAKYHAGVFSLWATILRQTPESRLILKWRTFNDAEFRRSVADQFVALGVAAERVELRGPSFHKDMLDQYGDIDIGLDPFPFSGGLTSCEALWMGVPVVTWPQEMMVSRQTFAILSSIGLDQLAATDGEGYRRIAIGLARDIPALVQLRSGLREQMLRSPLMDLPGFTGALEQCLIDLYRARRADCAS